MGLRGGYDVHSPNVNVLYGKTAAGLGQIVEEEKKFVGIRATT